VEREREGDQRRDSRVVDSRRSRVPQPIQILSTSHIIEALPGHPPSFLVLILLISIHETLIPIIQLLLPRARRRSWTEVGDGRDPLPRRDQTRPRSGGGGRRGRVGRSRRSEELSGGSKSSFVGVLLEGVRVGGGGVEEIGVVVGGVGGREGIVGISVFFVEGGEPCRVGGRVSESRERRSDRSTERRRVLAVGEPIRLTLGSSNGQLLPRLSRSGSVRESRRSCYRVDGLIPLELSCWEDGRGGSVSVDESSSRTRDGILSSSSRCRCCSGSDDESSCSSCDVPLAVPPEAPLTLPRRTTLLVTTHTRERRTRRDASLPSSRRSRLPTRSREARSSSAHQPHTERHRIVPIRVLR